MCPGLLRFVCHWLSIRLFSPNALIKVPPSQWSKRLATGLRLVIKVCTTQAHR